MIGTTTARDVRTLFRFATAGSVDDGKSTLVGRLLHDSSAILADQLDAVTSTSADRGFGGETGGIDFALLTDGLRAEREQGITIDVAYRYFSTDRRSFILADCPGHVQYTRNMVTGATTADAVVLLIDVRTGVVEQTRRHLAVAHLLRVPHVIVAVNKIDLAGFDGVTFARVEAEILALTDGLDIADVRVVPVSALLGDNVVTRSTRTTPWYDGPSLLEVLDSLPTTDELERKTDAFRLPVQLVIRPQTGDEHRDYRAYAGRVSSGSVSVGDAVTVSPAGLSTVVVGIDAAGRELDRAVAPQSVSLRLADDVDAARGATIVSAGTAPHPVSDASVALFWLDPRPLAVGARLLVKHGTATVQGMVTSVTGRLDLSTLASAPTAALEANDIGSAVIRLASALPLEPFARNRHGGSFLLINPRDGATLAAGIVIDRRAA